MQTKLNPYLSFLDNAREAMAFYQSVFGGKLELSTFGEFHAAQDASEENLIMHAVLTADNGLVLMGSDTPKRMQHNTGANNISLSLNGDNEVELRGYFDKLAAGGETIMPLERAMWGDMFGMCNDKYGFHWMVNVYAAKPAA